MTYTHITQITALQMFIVSFRCDKLIQLRVICVVNEASYKNDSYQVSWDKILFCDSSIIMVATSAEFMDRSGLKVDCLFRLLWYTRHRGDAICCASGLSYPVAVASKAYSQGRPKCKKRILVTRIRLPRATMRRAKLLACNGNVQFATLWRGITTL